MTEVQAIRWDSDRGLLLLLDQRRLPASEEWLEIDNARSAATAIRDLVVRGAPAIGVTAAYAVVLALREHEHSSEWKARVRRDMETLAGARPTAVNLAWALRRMEGVVEGMAVPDTASALAEARAIHDEDVEANRAIGRHGAQLIAEGDAVLTHCNTGSLATGGYGTALGVIRAAHEQGKLRRVFAGETRPWLQGARLTAWELIRDGIPVELVIEGAVAPLFRAGMAQWLIVGADRIVANGDVANKIGTYSAASHARRHGAKVMVAAPSSTVDLSIASGDEIPLEHRDPGEILSLGEYQVAADGAGAWNPVFDITPAELIDAIVTEKGVARPPFTETLEPIA